MPKFTSIEYKNIQSVGNHPIKIQLDKSSNTLIMGKNGTGKTTLGFAISYALFGKFPSGVKLQSAINSINKKNLSVTIKFTERGSEYTVIRGEKPKKFEIYKDNEMLDQNAHSRDQQKVLEQIIGMDFKVFTQVILLNKEKYIPFMDLAMAERRKIVEDILGISVFSEMNDVCKKRIKENQREVANSENQMNMNRVKLDGQQKLINQIQESLNEAKQETQSYIDANLDFIGKQEQIHSKLSKQIDSIDLSGHPAVKQQKREFEQLAVQFDAKQKSINKINSFFNDNDTCPTCKQDITDELKADKQHECDSSIKEIHSTLSEMMGELDKVVKQNKQYEELITKKSDLMNELRQIEFKIKEATTSNSRLMKSLDNVSSTDKLDTEITYYNEIENSLVDSKAALEELIKHGEDLEQMRVMLKDDGIKAVIVKEYMNLMNKKINEYLQAMNFYVNMILDENFKESFSAMHKENFTMSNLSTGQKTRVNIAIWLALLEISSIKNSIVSNIMFLDEILENLDSEGVKDVMSLFNEKLSDKNIFVVTQRAEEFNDLFRSSIEFKLNQNFTEIV